MNRSELLQDDTNDIPEFPRRMSREEARQIKERKNAFKVALKTQAKGTGWRHADGSIFKQKDEWFLCNSPSLAYKSGVILQWKCKPMAIDPLFWEIFHLEENRKQPLSFRDRGAWTIRPLGPNKYIARDETSPEKLAEAVIQWSNKRREEVADLTLDVMLANLGPLNKLSANKAEAICLLILLGQLDEAERLCRESDPKDSGGYTSARKNGGDRFYDYALDWIANKKASKSN